MKILIITVSLTILVWVILLITGVPSEYKGCLGVGSPMSEITVTVQKATTGTTATSNRLDLK